MQKTPIPPVSSGPGYERIKDALETILASEKFLSAPQMSAFLRYVVVQAATGNQGRIKAYTVAVDALGKPETFDPQNDPVVRVLAGRLRSTLSAYYELHPDSDVIIEMKPGSYVPSFIMQNASKRATENNKTTGTGDSNTDDTASAPEDSIIDTMLPSVDMADAANNQWSLDSSGQPLASAGSLNASYEQNKSNGADSARSQRFGMPGNDHWLPLNGIFRRFPRITAAAALCAAVLVGMYLNGLGRPTEPALLASKMSSESSPASGSVRARPDSISLFVSATTRDNSLASQVNTTMTSVFSESGDFRVYRMLQPAQIQPFWPEDYHLSLNVLPLTDETQISVQLVDAQTGRIAHSEMLHLSADASNGLSTSDMKTITDCARRLVSEDGPLVRDYTNKTSRQ